MVTGFILLDKPAGITSYDAVRHVRKLIRVGLPAGALAKVGHTGTLDPFATGLLIALLGSATRLVEYLLDVPKMYVTTITLGATSDTDDITGNIWPGAAPAVADKRRLEVPSKQEVEAVLYSFTGQIQQVPPAYAATKIKGKRAYQYARAGDRVKQSPRKITIYTIKLLHYNYPKLILRITCGRGTYIRALARDIGATLKTGGYCSTLRRLAIGQFTIKDAYQLPDLPAKLSTTLQPVELLINHLPKLTLNPDNVAKFKQGKAQETNLPGMPNVSSCAVLDTNSKLIGIGQIDPDTSLLHPHKVLNQARVEV